MEQKEYKTFYIEHTPDTFSGLLLAFGLAVLLETISKSEIEIVAEGGFYRLTLEQALDDLAWLNCAGLAGQLPYIYKKPDQDQLEKEINLPETESTKKAKPTSKPESVPAHVKIFDYNQERLNKSDILERKKNYRELLKKNIAQDEINIDISDEPDPFLPIAELVVQMKGPITAYNQIVTRWSADEKYWEQYVQLLLNFFSTLPNNLKLLENNWQKLRKENSITGAARLTAVQIFTPTAGKGGDAAKANGLSIGQKDNFWLLEMLKIFGMQVAGLPITIKDSGDRKTYLAVPAKLYLGSHKVIWNDLKKLVFPSNSIKLDIQVTLRYVKSFITNWEAGLGQPSEFLAGLMVAHYKDLGSAKALINLSRINLPDWIRLERQQDAEQYEKILKEHENIIFYLDDKRGDEYALLQLYREFLSGHTLQSFFNFAARYSATMIKRLENGQPAPNFTTDNLEVLIMAYAKNDRDDLDLVEVFNNSGFRNIAKAIRRSTISPQFQKALYKKGQKAHPPVYEIRYGLGEELRRKSAYRADFINALTDFMYSYNQESSQKFENPNVQYQRTMLTTNDIEIFAKLLKNDKSSQIIGGLLVAYGYARDPQSNIGKVEGGEDNEAEGFTDNEPDEE